VRDPTWIVGLVDWNVLKNVGQVELDRFSSRSGQPTTTDGRIYRENPRPHSPSGQSLHVSRSETGSTRIWHTRNGYHKKRIQRQGPGGGMKWGNDRRVAPGQKRGDAKEW